MKKETFFSNIKAKDKLTSFGTSYEALVSGLNTSESETGLKKGECLAECEWKSEANGLRAKIKILKGLIKNLDNQNESLKRKFNEGLDPNTKAEIIRDIEKDQTVTKLEDLNTEKTQIIDKLEEDISKIQLELEKSESQMFEMRHEFEVDEDIKRKLENLKELNTKYKKEDVKVRSIIMKRGKVEKEYKEIVQKHNQLIDLHKELEEKIKQMKKESKQLEKIIRKPKKKKLKFTWGKKGNTVEDEMEQLMEDKEN